MAFLDSTQGQSSQQQSQNPKRRISSLEAVRKPRPSDAALAQLLQLMEKATAHQTQAPGNHAGPGDGKEALIRNQGDQGKEQSAMKPDRSRQVAGRNP